MSPWTLYLIAVIFVALARNVMGWTSRSVLLLMTLIAGAESLHVLIVFADWHRSARLAILALGVVLPWGSAAGVLALRPANWSNGATMLAVVGSYFIVLALGLGNADTAGLVPH